MCQDEARHNEVLIRPVHRGPTLNVNLLGLAGVKCLTIIDASSGYHNIKLDERSSYVTIFSCPFGRYIYMTLSFGVAQVGYMFPKKIGELFSGIQNVFSIADDILIAGFDEQGKDHNTTLDKVLRVCRQANVKLNKDKCLFTCTSIPFFDEIISQQGISPDPRRVQTLTDMPPPKSKEEL